MAEIVAAILRWAIPIVVVFAVAAIAVAVTVWSVRRARRSPRARTNALAVRDRAGASLVRLDDAVSELDLEVELSGALHDGGAPASLRRARLTGQHVRDDCFEELRAVGDDAHPADITRSARRIERRATEALGVIASARAEHRSWMQAHVAAGAQLTSVQQRFARLQESVGNPDALIAELAGAYDDSEWAAAARAASTATAELGAARRSIAAAASRVGDPSTSALADLAAAERSLRLAEADMRTLEETHRLIIQAAQALPGEFTAARAAVRQALSAREDLPPDSADRLTAEIRAVDAGLTDLEPDSGRRPSRTVEAIARLRDRLDLALGDARTAQQRLRGARTALPGTLATARGAVARAEAAAAHSGPSAEARARLRSAQHELAAARQADDPVTALDAARRAIRHADDAEALAEFTSRSPGPGAPSALS